MYVYEALRTPTRDLMLSPSSFQEIQEAKNDLRAKGVTVD